MTAKQMAFRMLGNASDYEDYGSSPEGLINLASNLLGNWEEDPNKVDDAKLAMIFDGLEHDLEELDEAGHFTCANGIHIILNALEEAGYFN